MLFMSFMVKILQSQLKAFHHKDTKESKEIYHEEANTGVPGAR